jgi:protein-S-isoprenylcysteine O-methyltransferase Ste14
MAGRSEFEEMSEHPYRPEEPSDDDPPRSRGVWWVAVQGGLFLFFIAALLSGDTVDDFEGLVYIQSAGLLAALFGAFVSGWSIFQHRSGVSPFPKPVEGAVLVDTGPYRFVRHPMYSGIIAFTLGSGIAFGNIAAALVAPAFLVFFIVKSGHEEEMLVDDVPGYRQYRSDVHWLLIPRVL